MRHFELVVYLAGFFVALLVLAIAVWAIWVRPFARKSGARLGSPYTLAALVHDFGASLTYGRGPLPLSLSFFGFLLIAMLSDVILILIVVLFV